MPGKRTKKLENMGNVEEQAEAVGLLVQNMQEEVEIGVLGPLVQRVTSPPSRGVVCLEKQGYRQVESLLSFLFCFR